MSTITGNASVSIGATTTPAIQVPSGALAGHLLYVGIQVNSNAVTISNLNGFTEEALLLPTGGGTTLFVLSRILSAADVLAGSITITITASAASNYVAASIADVQTGDFKDGTHETGTNFGSPNAFCSQVNPSAANIRLLMIACDDNDTVTIVSWDTPLATLDQEASGPRRVAIGTGVQVSPGLSGSKILTFSGNGRHAAYLVALENGPTRGRGMLLGVGS